MSSMMIRRRQLLSQEFIVFDLINQNYPEHYKYISDKYDDSEYFAVLIKQTTSSTSADLLYCSKNQIIASLTVTTLAITRKPIVIDDYIVFFNSTASNVQYTLYVYKYENQTITYKGVASNCGRYLISSFFSYKTDETHHYVCATTNMSKNTPVVVLLENLSVYRTEGTEHLIAQYIKKEANSFIGLFSYYDIEAHYPALYETSVPYGAKNYSSPLSNLLTTYYSMYIIPQFAVHEKVAIRGYGKVDGVSNQDCSFIVSADYSTISPNLPDFVTGSLYSFVGYGAINIDNHTFYSFNIVSKNIEKITI